MSSHHLKIVRTLVRDSFALGLAAPEVIARRLLAMSLAGTAPSRLDQAEMVRMSAEKLAAFYESWNAMVVEMGRANLRFAMTWWAWPGGSPRSHSSRLLAHAQGTAAAVAAAGLAPVRRRAVANVKRLRRRRR